MSSNLKHNRDFIQVLLSTPRAQARAILKTANPQQVSALSEIAHNLLTITVPKSVRKLVAKCKKVFKKLSRNFTSKTKLKLILSICSIFLSILIAVKPLLLQLLI